MRLEVFGHAMTANLGQDVVCASVSSLMYGLCEAVAAIPEGRIVEGHMVCKPGHAERYEI